MLYNAEVAELNISNRNFQSGRMLLDGQPAEFRAKMLVVASGGFESNLEWLEEAWGPAARNFIVRGTPYNQGRVLKLLLKQGAEQVGDATQCHAVAIDGRAPKFDGGIVTRLNCVPLGIVVNAQAERFYDEGEDLWPKRYAIWGRLVAQQPDQIAYSIIDSKVLGRCMPSVFPAIAAASIAELSAKSWVCPRTNLKPPCGNSIKPCGQENSITRFSTIAAPTGSSRRNPIGRSGSIRPRSTVILCGPALPSPYLGVRVNDRAEVQGFRNVFAAGEIMAGNVVGKGYLAGLGMTIGSVFGRIAGREAALAAAR